MSRYTWTPSGQDEGNIVGSRFSEQVTSRLGLADFSASAQRDIALLELLAMTPEVPNVNSYGATGDATTNDRAAFVDLEADADHGFVPAGTYLISSNLTLSKVWTFARGAKLKPASGVTVTISGPVNAGLWQIFDTSAGGTVTFGAATVEVFLPHWWGAVADGTTDDSPAVKAAVDAAVAAGGGIVYFPVGTYYIDTVALALGDNVTLAGAGWGTIIDNSLNPFVTGSAVSNIEIRDMKILAKGNKLQFTDCNQLKFDNLFIDGYITDTNNSQQVFVIEACNDVQFTRCTVKDCRDPLYLTQNAAGDASDRVKVHGCHFYHDTHGADAFPAQIYVLEVRSIVISDCTFRNIIPGNVTASSNRGNCIYEGDGECDSIQVINCHFKATHANSAFMLGVRFTRARVGKIIGCTFDGSLAEFRGFEGSAKFTTIDDCTFDGASCHTSPETGWTPEFVRISNCDFLNVDDRQVLILNNGTPTLPYAEVVDCFLKNCAHGGPWFRFVTHGVAKNVTVIDCNTSGTSDDWSRGGINYFGCDEGTVDGCTVLNIAASGLVQYGVSIGASEHRIDVTHNNRFRGMVTGTVLRALTAPPTAGTWMQGQRIHRWGVAAGGSPGWYCTTGGAPGTWKAEANVAT
jgi:hypothetical protein